MSTSIVIADDHPLMLRGLSDFLSSKGYSILGKAEDGQSAYNLIIKHKPDIAILDIRMPYLTGLEVAEQCQKHKLDTKVILITFDNEEALFDKAKEFNVYGYILKEFAIEEIEICIDHVTKKEKYFSEEIASYLNSKIKYSNAHIKELLTKTELKIVKQLSKNKSNQEIANTLQSSIRTIEKHRSNIVKKLKLQKSHNALMLWANLNKDLF
ncbi:LuxR family two component transcriptional regulator [Lacinutrix venerupis]|uniref:response regulator transcription factor n=1 Tax=Lacinutrix venerupis TaxID=1486034 RepID=UPI000EB4BFA6|nr:response regulator transcription factor [Lacinutrix venerupis]RLJ61458.1 LuxR family two component transcriptional regulator [Lacinutrix venerupis]